MDILHLNKDQIRNLEVKEYEMAVKYSWTTYMKRDINFNLKEMFKTNKNGKNEAPFDDVDWTGINPVEQALRARKREIPPKFMESLKNE